MFMRFLLTHEALPSKTIKLLGVYLQAVPCHLQLTPGKVVIGVMSDKMSFLSSVMGFYYQQIYLHNLLAFYLSQVFYVYWQKDICNSLSVKRQNFIRVLELLHNTQSLQHLQGSVFKAHLVTLQLILCGSSLFSITAAFAQQQVQLRDD